MNKEELVNKIQAEIDLIEYLISGIMEETSKDDINTIKLEELWGSIELAAKIVSKDINEFMEEI